MQPIKFKDSPEFRRDDADALILTPAPPRPPLKPIAENSTPYQRMCREWPLTRHEERYYFRKMNYLKFKAEQIRTSELPDAERIRELLTEASEIRNLIVSANMGLIGVTHRFRTLTDERLSDCVVCLFNCVANFQYFGTVKFSTYGYHALRFLRRQFKPGTQLDPLEDGSDPIEAIEDHRFEAPDRRLMCSDDQRIVSNAMRHLSQRYQHVVSRHYGLTGDVAESYDEIGAAMGVSRSRVGQIQNVAIKTLRTHLSHYAVAEAR